MPLYELIFLVRQDVSQAQVTALSDYFKSLLEEHGASVPKVEYCGLRNLAYRVKRNKKAHYVLMNIEGPSVAVDEVERQLRLHEDILRHLRVSVTQLDNNPSALAQNRAHRDREDDDAPQTPRDASSAPSSDV